METSILSDSSITRRTDFGTLKQACINTRLIFLYSQGVECYNLARICYSQGDESYNLTGFSTLQGASVTIRP